MNIPAAIVLSSLALGVGGVASFYAFGPERSVAAAESSAASVDAQELAGLRTELAELRVLVGDLKSAPGETLAAPRQAAGGVSAADLEAAIAAYVQKNGGALTAAAESQIDAAGALGSPADIAALLADADDATTAELWKRLVEEGLDDEVLAHLAAIAEANPNDPEVQLELGQAYLGRTQEAGAGPLAGKYATLADEALDAALVADPEHWEARFTKAAALSFWPPILGKQPAAIQQFETLLTQQAGRAPEEHHAQTHLLLGTLYQQTGQSEKALATWQSGLGLFPGNASLAQQIQMAQGQ